MSISESIRESRKSSGKTQSECAAEVGVSLKTWGTWERGEGSPTADKVPAICKALGVSVSELFGTATHIGKIEGIIRKSHRDDDGNLVIDDFELKSVSLDGFKT